MRMSAVVHGSVQGVSFRRFVRDHARRLGLGGWVRNLAGGGAVEVVAEGPRPDLEGLLALLREGAPRGRVTGVDVDWGEPQGDVVSFEVRF